MAEHEMHDLYGDVYDDLYGSQNSLYDDLRQSAGESWHKLRWAMSWRHIKGRVTVVAYAIDAKVSTRLLLWLNVKPTLRRKYAGSRSAKKKYRAKKEELLAAVQDNIGALSKIIGDSQLANYRWVGYKKSLNKAWRQECQSRKKAMVTYAPVIELSDHCDSIEIPMGFDYRGEGGDDKAEKHSKQED